MCACRHAYKHFGAHFSVILRIFVSFSRIFVSFCAFCVILCFTQWAFVSRIAHVSHSHTLICPLFLRVFTSCLYACMYVCGQIHMYITTQTHAIISHTTYMSLYTFWKLAFTRFITKHVRGHLHASYTVFTFFVCVAKPHHAYSQVMRLKKMYKTRQSYFILLFAGTPGKYSPGYLANWIPGSGTQKVRACRELFTQTCISSSLGSLALAGCTSYFLSWICAKVFVCEMNELNTEKTYIHGH